MSQLTLKVNTATYTEEQGAFIPEDTLTATLPALFRRTAEGWTLSYSENDENGKTATRLLFDAQSDKLTLTRRGAFDYTLFLKKKEPSSFLYRVPPVAFDGEALLLTKQGSLNESGGTLSLSYTLTLGGTRRKIDLTLLAVRP